LTIFDTAGLTDQYASIPTTYVTQSHGFVLVYSIDDRSSFENCKDIYRNLMSASSGSVPIVLVANKTDLENQRLIKYDEGKQLADQWKAYFLETSAQTGDKVIDVFTSCLNIIENNRNGINNNINQDQQQLQQQQQQQQNQTKQDKSCIIS
jgi:small GTP-binding protein